MKIGLDISQTGPLKAGCGIVAYQLMQELSNIAPATEFIFYPTFGDAFFDPIWKKNIRIPGKNNCSLGIGHKNAWTLYDFWSCLDPKLREEKLGNPDIIHANNFYCPKELQKSRLVYTVYDTTVLLCPEYTTEENRVLCFNGLYFASLYADYLIAISQYTKNSFLSFFPHYPKERISVVPLGSRFMDTDRTILRQRSCPVPFPLETDSFWLHVGTLEPRKNHCTALRAYAKLKQDGTTRFPLVFAGGKGWMYEEIYGCVVSLGLEEDVIFTGYVPDSLLAWLLANCFALIYPSCFEGFGLPVLEAMSLGRPVITSSSSSLPELVGTGGLICSHDGMEELAGHMRRLLHDVAFREGYSAYLSDRAKLFQWRNTAEKVKSIYEQTLALPKR